MAKQQTRDSFISYKNDGEGRNFSARICADLQKLGYSVYYNPNGQHAGSFPERLTAAVSTCTDLLLIVTQPCLDQLMRYDKVDWVREEVLTARRMNKNTIPLLMPGAAAASLTIPPSSRATGTPSTRVTIWLSCVWWRSTRRMASSEKPRSCTEAPPG